MNDFTKEELKFLNNSINHFDWLFNGDFNQLKNKLQSMIDTCSTDECNSNHMYVVDKCATCGRKL